MRTDFRSRRFLFLVAASLLCSAAFAQTADVGLSSVRAQRFGRLDLPNPNAGGDDRFASAFAVGDFDNDGADDLATGVPRSDGPTAAPVDQCGQVVVRYGIPGRGLDEISAPTVLGQFVAGSWNPAQVADRFGSALVACDLNGDDFDDLAVGVPYQTYTLGGLFTITEGGVVDVYYGSAAGLVPPASAHFREVPPAMNLPASGAHFGWALGCGDFDHDGDDDLAVAMPNHEVGSRSNAGRINIFPGSPSGLGGGAYLLDQEALDGQPDTGDLFGYALATGDFDGDDFADLAVGVPGEYHPVFGLPVGGAHVLYGVTNGLGTGRDEIYCNPEEDLVISSNGHFGRALAVGNFDADLYDDLVIGSPLEDLSVVPSIQDTGIVAVISGSGSGLAAPTYQELSAETILGDGESVAGERFGWAVAADDFDGDGADDLAVGVPYEDRFATDEGAITLLMGAVGTGLDPDSGRSREINHGFEGFPGAAGEQLVVWGMALSSGDFDGDGHADLAVGAPFESETQLDSVGTEAILYGALFADGFEGSLLWSTAVP